MNAKDTNNAQLCRNVMETLVKREIDLQVVHLPPHLKKYINRVEVMTYAINRVPALYASSEKGWQYQLSRAEKEFGQQIAIVVRQALAAVQRDPLRVAAPLKAQEEEIPESEVALKKLKILLQNEQLNWENLVAVVEQALVKTVHGEITWKSRSTLAHVGRSSKQI